MATDNSGYEPHSNSFRSRNRSWNQRVSSTFSSKAARKGARPSNLSGNHKRRDHLCGIRSVRGLSLCSAATVGEKAKQGEGGERHAARLGNAVW